MGHVAQTLPPRQLRKGEAAELIEAGKAFDLVIPAVSRHAPAKDGPRRCRMAQATAPLLDSTGGFNVWRLWCGSSGKQEHPDRGG